MSPFIKNILRIICYGGVYFIFERFLVMGGPVRNITVSCTYPFLVFISVVNGPLVGGLSAALGKYLIQINAPSVDWILIICAFLNCAWIARGMKDVGIRNGVFNRIDILHFNNVQLLSNIVCWVLVYPLLTHFLLKVNLMEVFQSGIWTALGYFLSDVIAATLFLAIYAQSRMTAVNFYRN